MATTSSELGARKRAPAKRSSTNGQRKNGNGNGHETASARSAPRDHDDEARIASDRQLAAIAAALRSLQAGDFGVRLPTSGTSTKNAAARDVACGASSGRSVPHAR